MWIIDHVRYLHDNGLLAAVAPTELATHIIAAACHLDIHGDLPATWPTVPLLVDQLRPLGIEVG